MAQDKDSDLILKAAQKLKAGQAKKEPKQKVIASQESSGVSQDKSLVEKATDVIDGKKTKSTLVTNQKARSADKVSESDLAQTSNQTAKKRDKGKAFINLAALSARGIIDPNGERTLIAEEYRLIKRPLLLTAFKKKKASILDSNDKLNNLIIVTSSEENEGKSFTSVNLAMSIASERDLHVLLIDCDMHANRNKNSVMNTLGIDAKKGFLDVLIDKNLDVSEVMLSTNIENLSVLPVGEMKDEATELFASKRMAEKIREIALRYSDRIIIIDAPPVLMASETSVIAMHAGQAVYVVEAERTAQKDVDEGIKRMSFCPSVNLVLNKINPSFGDEHQTYRYRKNKYNNYDETLSI